MTSPQSCGRASTIRFADSEKRGRDWPRDPDGVPLYPAADKALPISERNRRIAGNAPFA